LYGKLAPLVRTLIAVGVTVFVAEILIMLVMVQLGYVARTSSVVLWDALVLAMVTAPPVYFLIRYSLRREHEMRLRAEKKAEEAGHLAITDSLTQVLNRRGIKIALLQAIAQSERYHHALSVALVDIDRFKDVNDTYGHQTGDLVLKRVARLLTETLRAPDSMGRYGGEEFLLVLPETDLEATNVIAERIRRRVRETDFEAGGAHINVTVSIGATQFQNGEALTGLFGRVDRALYEAKQSGRNLVVAR
jgi:diguanylate cyclase (GGDEF)-like protein